jgi:hypothetical protein
MTEKTCKTCNETKDINEFHKQSSSADGYRNKCKTCRHAESIDNKDKKTEYNKLYYSSKKTEILQNNKNYRDTNKDSIKEQKKKYREINADHIKMKMKEYLPIRKKKIKDRRKTDMTFRISEVYRSKFNRAIKRSNEKSTKFLGCTKEHLLKWLESQFDNNITWDNYGKFWHIDHIIPISFFDLKKENEQKICFNWKNLQPLEGKENLSKSNKILTTHIVKLWNNIRTNKMENNSMKTEYQGLKNNLIWLREKLRYGNNLEDEKIINKIIFEIDNSQPNS